MEILPTHAYLITEDYEVSEINPANGNFFELEEAQRYVDGYIEVVNLNDSQIMIVNEEGKFTKGCNQTATAIARLYNAIASNDYISGDAVICPSAMLP